MDSILEGSAVACELEVDVEIWVELWNCGMNKNNGNAIRDKCQKRKRGRKEKKG